MPHVTRWSSVQRGLAGAGLIAAAAGGAVGCAAGAAATPPIQVASAYIPVPSHGTTVAYVVIRNNGSADQLVSATTSDGGRVTFQAPSPAGAGGHTIAAVPIPADSTVAMRPDGYHIVITGARGMRGGKDISLTLNFARAGPVTVVAQVTNPETGGNSYFLN
jgi:copper(I)-binding protein